MDLGTPIKGPSALGTDRRRLARLTWTLAYTDFKLRFFGSVLGYLWQLMQPLMLFGVLYVVFSLLLNFSGPEQYYPVSLLLGIVLFTFLNESTAGAVRSIVARENLVRKIEFPRLAVPLATVLMALMNLGLNLVPVFVFLLAAGGAPRLSWLEFPLLIAIFALFAAGLAMLLSSLFVRARDVEPIWTVVLQMLFYATPIFWTTQAVLEQHPNLGWAIKLLMLNPFAAIVQQSRHAVLGPSYPSISQLLGGGWLVLAPLAIIAVVIVIGSVVFSRMAPKIAEEL